MDTINEDILSEICKHLSINDICNCFSVCRQFNEMLKSNLIWNPIYDKINDNIIKSVIMSVQNKKQFYYCLHRNYCGKIKNILHIKNELKMHEGFNEIFNLKIIYKYGSSIKIIPTEISQLINLQELYLNYNQISTIPTEISQLINLEWLDLDNNGITAIPVNLTHMAHIIKIE